MMYYKPPMAHKPPMARFKQKGDTLHLYITSLRDHDGVYVRVVDGDGNKKFIWPATFGGFNQADDTDVYAISTAKKKLEIPLNDDTFFDRPASVEKVELLTDADDGDGKKVLKKHD